MAKKVLVILGHPSEKSFCNAIAESYAQGAKSSGAEVKILKIGSLKFDPILHEGYNKIQKLEPDLKKAQAMIKWADHLVWVYPSWWATMPALMKGFIDRILLPGFGFRFKDGSMKSWDKLFTGKTGHLIMTMGAPSFVYKYFFGAPAIKEMKRGILGFCGVKPIKTTMFGMVEGASDSKREAWLAKIRKKGEKQE